MNEINLRKVYLMLLENIDNIVSADEVEYYRNFIRTKINNGTLYTDEVMKNYPLLKRFQLFINSNVAEHAIVEFLNAKLLDGNDALTTTSRAVIGADGCAEADVTIDGIEVEVKVTLNEATKNNIFEKAHKKTVVAVYIISDVEHWHFYIRQLNGEYKRVEFLISKPNHDSLVDLVYTWQKIIREKCNKLTLIRFDENEDKTVTIHKM